MERRSFLKRLLAACGLGALAGLNRAAARGYTYSWRHGETWTDDPAYNQPGGPALSFGLHNHATLNGLELHRGVVMPDGLVCHGPVRLHTGPTGWVEMYCADPTGNSWPILTPDGGEAAVFRYHGHVTFRDDEFGNILRPEYRPPWAEA